MVSKFKFFELGISDKSFLLDTINIRVKFMDDEDDFRILFDTWTEENMTRQQIEYIIDLLHRNNLLIRNPVTTGNHIISNVDGDDNDSKDVGIIVITDDGVVIDVSLFLSFLGFSA
jgi:hypothetical protein